MEEPSCGRTYSFYHPMSMKASAKPFKNAGTKNCLTGIKF
jgi:hypothetical protein